MSKKIVNQSTEEILHWGKDFDTIYSYDAGPVRSKFLTKLRDNEKIVGTKCPACDMAYVPARSTCLKCFTNLSDFVEVSKTGTLTTFSVVNCSQPYYPQQSPLIYGIIQLDGADTGLVHLLGEVDPCELTAGIRVQAVFKKERTGSILDIKYFKPIGGE